MYNPFHLHQCEKEKRRMPRRVIDNLMILVGVIASLSSAPQLVKNWQIHDASGVSLITYLIALGSVAVWFFYGLYIKNRPLIYTSAVSIVIISGVVWQILVYR